MNNQKPAKSILAIDYGSKFTGLAVASGVKIARPLKTLLSLSDDQLIAELLSLIEELNIGLILVGQPLNLRGEASKQSITVEDFTAKLKSETKTPIVMQAETDTTNWAKEAAGADSTKLKSAKASGQIDALAATKILQDYLDEYGFEISS